MCMYVGVEGGGFLASAEFSPAATRDWPPSIRALVADCLSVGRRQEERSREEDGDMNILLTLVCVRRRRCKRRRKGWRVWPFLAWWGNLVGWGKTRGNGEGIERTEPNERSSDVGFWLLVFPFAFPVAGRCRRNVSKDI